MQVDTSADTGALLKLLGEPLRWEIVRRLAAEDLCNCHLVAELDATQPLISHHLRALRQAGVVTTERVGAFTYYRLERHVIGQLSDQLGDIADEHSTRRRPCT